MPTETLDKRLNPVRPDLAAAYLRGKAQAVQYVDGVPATVAVAVAAVRPHPELNSSLDTQAIFGERLIVYEQRDGWAWVQLERDNYVGYVMEADLRFGAWREASHRITALRAPVFSMADLKSAPRGFLPMNSEVRVQERQNGYVAIDASRWLAVQHVCDISVFNQDWVGVAESILGAPYLWGGKTPDGLDCSGLVQVALSASGLFCPRDTDMQERELGEVMPTDAQLRRGDLVFWKGHVGIMRDESRLLHANAHHMAVASEPVAEAIARIAAKGTSVSSIRRLNIAAL